MRITGPMLKVLRALLAEYPSDAYGLDLMRSTGLKSGTLYPLMERLLAEGWIADRWEDIDPTAKGRPRRRYFVLTGRGAVEARGAVASTFLKN